MLTEKPPVGLTPHKIWLETRIKNLHEAIGRYLDAGIYTVLVQDWILELSELVQVYARKFPKK